LDKKNQTCAGFKTDHSNHLAPLTLCFGSKKKFDQARQTEAYIASIADPREYFATKMTRMLMRSLIEIT